MKIDDLSQLDVIFWQFENTLGFQSTYLNFVKVWILFYRKM